MASDVPAVAHQTIPPARRFGHVKRDKRLRVSSPAAGQQSSQMRPHRILSDTRQNLPTSCPYCLVNENQSESYLELENSMAKHRVTPQTDKSTSSKSRSQSMAPSSGPSKWRSAISSILGTLNRSKGKEGQQQRPKEDRLQWLIDSGVFQESDRQTLQEHVQKLPSSYASSGFTAPQVKEHIDLVREASRLKDGFVALRLQVSSLDEESCIADMSTSDSSCTSSAGGFSTLSSDGGSQVCRVDVSFAAPTHICRPDLASALRQSGFSLCSLTIFDTTPRGSLGHVVAKVYRDEFSKEILETIFASVLEQQQQHSSSSKRWLPIGVRRISGEYARDNSIFADRQCGSERGSVLSRNTGNDSGRRMSPFRSHRKPKTTSTGDVEGMLQVLGSGGDKKAGKQDISKFILDPLKVELGPVIAVGASGEVRKGMYDGKEVAVKILKSSMAGKDSKAVVAEFRREVLTLMSCGECPQLLQFYGIFVDVRSKMCIVTKYMKGGTLLNYLQSRKGLKLQMSELLQIATDVASGMEFLHKNGITHRDLKSANVLLDGEGHAVVGDFGVAKLKGERGEMTKEVGTYRWMAPEAFGTSAWPVTHKADVYSFGIVLWELISLQLPFETYTPVQAAVAVTLNGLRPAVPAECPPGLKVLIEKCWAKNPADRPDFSEVLRSLKSMA